MINAIKTLIILSKIVKFSKEGNMTIEFNKSKIKFTKQGDLIINAHRHTIHHRDLFFDGCEQLFIDKAIQENSKSKNNLEKFVMSSNRASEFVCDTNIKVKEKNVSN